MFFKNKQKENVVVSDKDKENAVVEKKEEDVVLETTGYCNDGRFSFYHPRADIIDYSKPLYKCKILYKDVSRYWYDRGTWYPCHQNIVSYEILEEVSDDVIYDYAKHYYIWCDSLEEIRALKNNSYYVDVYVPDKIVKMLDGMYSESFSLLLASKSLYDKSLIEKAIMFYEEGLSPDMRAYLLLCTEDKE